MGIALLGWFAQRRNRYILFAALGLAALLGFAFFPGDEGSHLYAQAAVGPFEVSITTTGELQALRSVRVDGPSDGMRSRHFRISELQIKDLVPEGTIVDSGDYVGALDKSVLSAQLKAVEDEVEKSQQQYTKQQLDTALTLRELRSTLRNLLYTLEEQRIVVEQSKYEPPATLRKAQIDLERTQRSYNQAEANYALRQEQCRASMREAYLNLQKELRKKEELAKLLDRFTVYAPMRGMVIYQTEWGGKKRKVGSSISAWDATIATLPDLSEMVSKSYINEVDVGLVKVGLPVQISVDAIPGGQYEGRVTDLANIGEQISGRDTRVFEYTVKLAQVDSLLRPSMSTTNRIVISYRDSVLSCPLECLHAYDTATYVYTQSGYRQAVRVGARSNQRAEILEGIEPGESLYLSVPAGGESFGWRGLP